MNENLSYYNLFLSIEQSIYEAHALDATGVSSFKRQHIKHRAFFLMKFDMLLDSYRKVNNSKADNLHGKNAAIAMCCGKFCISPTEVKKFTLDDIIFTLHTDINKFPVSQEILDEIRNPYPIDISEMEYDQHQLGAFIDAEWDPELRYRLTLRRSY
ncbi:hypothetical protein PUG81_25730 [Erwiniaceae bacterium L1_54_6]|nr:hypothetical protein [Erwiniaceae bacterium L1_54_6]